MISSTPATPSTAPAPAPARATGSFPYPPAGLPVHISPSSAKSYLACGLRFHFERVLRLKRPVSPALHLGKAVHAALQAFHLARWRGGDDSPDAVAAAFRSAFRSLELEEPVDWKDERAPDLAIADGLRVLATYLDSPEALRGRPKAVEVPLTGDIAGVPVPVTGFWTS